MQSPLELHFASSFSYSMTRWKLAGKKFHSLVRVSSNFEFCFVFKFKIKSNFVLMFYSPRFQSETQQITLFRYALSIPFVLVWRVWKSWKSDLNQPLIGRWVSQRWKTMNYCMMQPVLQPLLTAGWNFFVFVSVVDVFFLRCRVKWNINYCEIRRRILLNERQKKTSSKHDADDFNPECPWNLIFYFDYLGFLAAS